MLEIGKKPPKGITYETEEYRMTGSGSMEPMFRVRINNINYVFCEDKVGRVNYIETKDKNFITKEGLRVGMSYNEVASKASNYPELEKGWAYVLPLEKGWYAAFDLSKNNLEKMSSDSTIKWFYKRK